MPYAPAKERIQIADYPEAQPTRRLRRAAACASSRGDFQWMDIDLCAHRKGGDLKGTAIRGPADVSEFIHRVEPGLATGDRERVFVVCVNTQIQPLGVGLVSAGGLRTASVEIPLVLRPVLLLPSSGFFLIHNHPGGTIVPSPDDEALTERVKAAAETMGLHFYDHVIVTHDPSRFYSFFDGK